MTLAVLFLLVFVGICEAMACQFPVDLKATPPAPGSITSSCPLFFWDVSPVSRESEQGLEKGK